VAELFAVRLDDAIEEVERELAIRASFYPERVRLKRMTVATAQQQMTRLEAARDFLNELRMLRGGSYDLAQEAGGTLAGDEAPRRREDRSGN
jgi:hypothetical protein